jgi:hypothetical protein
MVNNGVYQSIDTIRQLLAISKDGSPVIIGFNNGFYLGFNILGKMLFPPTIEGTGKTSNKQFNNIIIKSIMVR